jgi:predicted regulator of Ras-like GTPase activity (Roadblock/LC7/MglB family)
MSAPLNVAKRFFKGLFGKGESSQGESSRDDTTYDYYQAAPVTGAQLKSPAPTAPAPVQKPVIAKAAPSPTAKSPQTQNAPVQARIVAKTPAVAPAPAPVHAQTTVATAPLRINTPVAAPKPAPAVSHATPPATVPGKFVNFPLAKIVAALPQELQDRVTRKNFGDFTIPVPFELVMQQLSTGVIRIPFGLIRENAPQFFAPNTDLDASQVGLPLGEVLKQVNPAQFAKPSNQIRLTADNTVDGPFAQKGSNNGLEVKGIAPLREFSPEMAAKAERQTSMEVPKPVAPTAEVPAPARITLPAAVNKPPAASPLDQIPDVFSPKKTASAAEPAATPAPAKAPATDAPQSGFAIPTQKITGAPSLRMSGGETATASPATASTAPASKPAPAIAHPPAPAKQSPPVAGGAAIAVGLKILMEAWPETVKAEILSEGLLNSSVTLPSESISDQLKLGRVSFTWADIRGWLCPKLSKVSELGGEKVDLPLKVIAPLFLGIKTGAPAATKIVADAAIPDVFAQAKPALHSDAAPAQAATAAAVPAPAPPAPVDTTPGGIVNRTALLRGVAGALIALPDGLVVASRLPGGLNAETMAAFLPQLCAKFDDGLKALKMSPMHQLSFNAGALPWRVYRTHKVIFAVFGRANEPLPADQLAALAKELE